MGRGEVERKWERVRGREGEGREAEKEREEEWRVYFYFFIFCISFIFFNILTSCKAPEFDVAGQMIW